AAVARWEAQRATPPLLPQGPEEESRVMAAETGATSLSRAELNMELGAALNERMSSFSAAQVQRWSVGLLIGQELFGTEEEPGLCEMPEILANVREDGNSYAASLAVYSYAAILNEPEPMWVQISAGCVAGLAEAAGDVEAAVADGACAEDEAMSFFWPGTDCRSCVEGNGGDYAGCQAALSCPEQVPVAVWAEDGEGERHWYRGVAATGWACAPDWLVPFYLMAEMGEDGVLPLSYDHDRWAFLCTPLMDEVAGQPLTSCQGGFTPLERGVLAEGLFGFVSALDLEGYELGAWRGRQYYVDEVSFSSGASLRWFWAFAGGLGALSAPRTIVDSNGSGGPDVGDEDWGYGSGGFGLNPREFRPDGSLLARDWLAAAQLKSSTTRNGVPILVSQRSRCSRWEDPAEDGSQRCLELGVPEEGWIHDAYTSHVGELVTPFPLVTLASTGQLDADVPGGLVVHVATSSTLAGWEDCRQPHEFVPDLISLEDQPGDWGGPAALDGQTWRFDKPDNSFRMTLSTNQDRGWCGGDASGPGRSALDL
ncbi:MAG TPA: hypothetical protein PLA94_14700, partial [Myxococcota bacterium]|nr:hypothetical protein [Myxococcota bacterium]